jgi:oxygen-independent coproporphyrinogen-3 oxidase
MDISDLITKYDAPVPRYTSYPTAPHFSPAIGGATAAEWLRALPDEPISLYLHVPFCAQLCWFCGCNTTATRSREPIVAYAELVLREIELVAAAIGRRLPVAHVHWGGGTPTAMPPDRMLAIMQSLRSHFNLLPDAEIAVEIDPRTLDATALDGLEVIGCTRASLGVQDFNETVQKAVHRRQSFEMTRDCAAAVRARGIASLNIDLIYGLPYQTEATVTDTAERALELVPDRIAVFGYAHVPWMKKHQALIPEASLPDALQRFAQQRAIHRVLTEEGGYRAIGLDHYARPGDSMADADSERKLKRGFQGYTTDDAPVLIGFGASAIGSLPRGYVQNATTAAAYGKAIESGGLATVRGIEGNRDDRLRRDVIERLMCDLEVDLIARAEAHDADPAPLLDDAAGVERFAADGLARWDGRRLEVTEKGRPFLRSLAALFDAYLVRDEQKPRHSRAI